MQHPAKMRELSRNLPFIYHIRKLFLLPRYKIIRSLLNVMDIEGIDYMRYGKDGDGGYVLADYFPKSTIAYSFGISNDVSFEKDIADKGIDVFMYDHTIEELPESNPRFHFNKLGISGQSNGNLRTMEELIQKNGHESEKNILLKMDVEGCEWDFFNNANSNTIQKFYQMVFEFHNMTKISEFTKIKSALEKINKTHQLVHIHANNHSSYQVFDGVIYPKMIEVAYLRKSDHKFIASNRIFPTPLDMPNNNIPGTDFELGAWNAKY